LDQESGGAAVIGGGAVGLETALLVAKIGTLKPEQLEFLMFHRAESDEKLHELLSTGSKEVTLFEMLPKVGQDVTARVIKIDKSDRRIGLSINNSGDPLTVSYPFNVMVTVWGSCEVWAWIDATGVVAETNESNNFGQQGKARTGRPFRFRRRRMSGSPACRWRRARSSGAIIRAA
jgi:hypothetical protein